MKAIVVYESHWGNTAAIAKAIGEGIGPDARVLTTSEATAAAMEGVDLIVAGAPLLGFSLPTDSMIKGLSSETSKGGPPPDLSHPSMRAWLETVPAGKGAAAAFDTKISWSPGNAAKAILAKLAELGYEAAAKPQRFVVNGRYGPLKPGELERGKGLGRGAGADSRQIARVDTAAVGGRAPCAPDRRPGMRDDSAVLGTALERERRANP